MTKEMMRLNAVREALRTKLAEDKAQYELGMQMLDIGYKTLAKRLHPDKRALKRKRR
jgi:hypothetical protein